MAVHIHAIASSGSRERSAALVFGAFEMSNYLDSTSALTEISEDGVLQA
jgi:hypothetical protein